MYRFLLSRRWLGLALAVLLLATLSVRLGFWQLSRFHELRDENAVTERNLAAAPANVDVAAGPDGEVGSTDEWKPVIASGRYDVDHQLLVRYQVSGSSRGVDVLVPLVSRDGSGVLVDRGFLESPSGTPDVADVPAPPSGDVTVTGWLRQDSDATSSATAPSDGAVRAVSAAALADTLPYPLAPGWVQARTETPPPDVALAGAEPPELDSGPHFFYAMQWWFFALLAVVGYLYFAYDEAHPGRRPTRRRRGDHEDGPEDDDVDAGPGTRDVIGQEAYHRRVV